MSFLVRCIRWSVESYQEDLHTAACSIVYTLYVLAQRNRLLITYISSATSKHIPTLVRQLKADSGILYKVYILPWEDFLFMY